MANINWALLGFRLSTLGRVIEAQCAAVFELNLHVQVVKSANYALTVLWAFDKDAIYQALSPCTYITYNHDLLPPSCLSSQLGPRNQINSWIIFCCFLELQFVSNLFKRTSAANYRVCKLLSKADIVCKLGHSVGDAAREMENASLVPFLARLLVCAL